jgi:hypothetical protein
VRLSRTSLLLLTLVSVLVSACGDGQSQIPRSQGANKIESLVDAARGRTRLAAAESRLAEILYDAQSRACLTPDLALTEECLHALRIAFERAERIRRGGDGLSTLAEAAWVRAVADATAGYLETARRSRTPSTHALQRLRALTAQGRELLINIYAPVMPYSRGIRRMINPLLEERVRDAAESGRHDR